MEQMLATPADAEIILKLYQLRTESLMREARAWVTGQFWPKTAEEFFAVAANPESPNNAYLRQVTTYWEMAAALVLHGAVSAELFIDTNGEGLFILGKFAPILEEIRKKTPGFMMKTSTLVSRFATAGQKYETIRKNVEAMRSQLAK